MEVDDNLHTVSSLAKTGLFLKTDLKIFEKALGETNDSIRLFLYQQADQVVINDAPIVPL